MSYNEGQSQDEAKRMEKHIAEEAEQLAKDQARRKAYLESEQAIADDLKARRIREAEKRAPEEAKQLAKDQARRKAYLESEQAIADDLKARRIREAEKRAPK